VASLRLSDSVQPADGLLGEATIVDATAWLVDVPVRSVRHDAVQTFTKQETIFVEIRTAGGATGLGYSYTIGTGGHAVLSLVSETLLPALVGCDVRRPEAIWATLSSRTRATMVGPITSLAIAAVDTAVWDLRCKLADLPLWVAAGGAQDRVPLYDTEGGWAHFDTDEIVERAIASRDASWAGVKIKVGNRTVRDDLDRLTSVRRAVGDDLPIMVDANQCFSLPEAVERARGYEQLGIAWFEEPLPADDVGAHQRLSMSTSVPIAVGESLYSVTQFKEYLQKRAASVVQVDVARIGGITPWLKVAHLAEAYNVPVAPHFLMELHVSLACAVPNATFVEHIPQLGTITTEEMAIENGCAIPPNSPGLGIQWDMAAIDELRGGTDR
jgi:L-alanine-DL-glutamate epimerase-like enolase superfamily enzyme